MTAPDNPLEDPGEGLVPDPVDDPLQNPLSEVAGPRPGHPDTEGADDEDAEGVDAEGMATGSDAGSPGERAGVPPDDAVTAAVQDDAPLPSGDDGPDHQRDDPQFREPVEPPA